LLLVYEGDFSSKGVVVGVGALAREAKSRITRSPIKSFAKIDIGMDKRARVPTVLRIFIPQGGRIREAQRQRWS